MTALSEVQLILKDINEMYDYLKEDQDSKKYLYNQII